MLMPSRRTAATLGLFSIFLGLSAMLGMQGPAAADDKDIAQALRAGGLVIVVRHGATFPDQADTDPLNFDNIAAQRNLNDKGKALAKTFGEALRQVPCRSARSTPASSTARTRPRSSRSLTNIEDR